MRILNVAYPFAPTGPDAVGGAEQVLTRLDRALVAAGHESWVLGCEGSRGFGCVKTAFPLPDSIGEPWKEHAYEVYRAQIEGLIDQHEIELVHLHGVDFDRYLPRRETAILATLHLPPSWYPEEIFSNANLWLHCVSQTQQAECPPGARLLSPIPNGVDLPELSARKKRNFALSLGRICPEKGFHLAMDGAREAHIPFALAGDVFPYEAHLAYFEKEIRTRETPACRFIGPIGGARKWRYLQAAKCLLIPSLVAETSSLVAMEALACGTPVIAFARGALPAIVDDRTTGFLVNDVSEMTRAIREVDRISSDACRAAARERFSGAVMTQRYLARYRELITLFSHERPRADREPVCA
jgi:glycosyltransferase involved in cell wall biosynthesis